MKNVNYSLTALAVVALLTVGACSDNDDDGSCKKSGAGLGGNNQVSGLVRHHSASIPGAHVFIKFGATEFPGSDTSAYDLSVMADSTAFYEFTGLTSGDYYLYSEGFDSGINLPVDGGTPLEICEGDSSIQKNVPVTEDH